MRTATTILLAVAAAAAGDDPVSLKPKWKAKERASVKQVETTSLVRGGDDMVLSTRKIEYVQVTTAVRKGLPVRATRTFTVHEEHNPFSETPRKHELAGQKLEFTLREGRLYNERVPALMTMGGGGDWTWMLPSKPVAVGGTWTVRKNVALMDVSVAFMANHTTCRLASVEGDKAVIEFTQPNDVIKGTAEFSLKAGRVLNASFVFLLKSEARTSKTKFTYTLTVPPAK